MENKAKEKAVELVKKFKEYTKVLNGNGVWKDDIISAKQCALICVDEIINELRTNLKFFLGGGVILERIDFMEQVKKEIINIK